MSGNPYEHAARIKCPKCGRKPGRPCRAANHRCGNRDCNYAACVSYYDLREPHPARLAAAALAPADEGDAR